MPSRLKSTNPLDFFPYVLFSSLTCAGKPQFSASRMEKISESYADFEWDKIAKDWYRTFISLFCFFDNNQMVFFPSIHYSTLLSICQVNIKYGFRFQLKYVKGVVYLHNFTLNYMCIFNKCSNQTSKTTVYSKMILDFFEKPYYNENV